MVDFCTLFQTQNKKCRRGGTLLEFGGVVKYVYFANHKMPKYIYIYIYTMGNLRKSLPLSPVRGTAGGLGSAAQTHASETRALLLYVYVYIYVCI